jgi:hypothetical protein
MIFQRGRDTTRKNLASGSIWQPAARVTYAQRQESKATAIAKTERLLMTSMLEEFTVSRCGWG